MPNLLIFFCFLPLVFSFSSAPNRINSSMNINEIESETIQSSTIFASKITVAQLKVNQIIASEGNASISLSQTGAITIGPQVTSLYYINDGKKLSPKKTTIIYDIQNIDSHLAYNSSGFYNVPISGMYSINAHLQLDNTPGWNEGSSFRLYLVTNGIISGTFALCSTDQMNFNQNIGFRNCGGNFLIYLNYGDSFYIETEIFEDHNDHSIVGDQSHSYLLIQKII